MKRRYTPNPDPDPDNRSRRQRPRTTRDNSSRKRSNSSGGQNANKRPHYVQHARSRVVQNPHAQSVVEKHRQAFLFRTEHARQVRLETAALRHQAAALRHQIETVEQEFRHLKRTVVHDEWSKLRKEQDLSFIQGQIADLNTSLAELVRANPGVVASASGATPVVHTLEEENETQTLLAALEKIIRNDCNKSLKELGELKRIIQLLREKKRSMHLSPHQNVRLGHMMAAISGKGWRIPRNQGIHSEIYF